MAESKLFCQFSDQKFEKKNLNCVFCQNLLTTPIMLVKDKGNACFVCYDKQYKCKFVAMPNILLDMLIKKVTFYCKNTSYGCKEIVLYEKLSDHLNTCKFNPKKCVIPLCEYKGNLPDLWSHIIGETHRKCFIYCKSNLFYFTINLYFERKIFKIFQTDNTFFILVFKIGKQKNVLSFKVYKNNLFDGNVTIKLYGNHNKYVGIKCKLSNFSEIYNFDSDLNMHKFNIQTLAAAVSSSYVIKVVVEIGNGSQQPQFEDINEQMLHQIECPICMEFMKPPILQCNSGHVFCNVCRPKFTTCPTCRQFLLEPIARNYIMEDLTAIILYPCKNKCNEKYLLVHLQQHETMYCRVKYCPEKCNFQGDVSTILSHLKKQHLIKINTADCFKSSYKFTTNNYVEYLLFDNNLFKIYFTKLVQEKEIYFVVQIVWNQNKFNFYKYEINVDGRKFFAHCKSNLRDLYKDGFKFPLSVCFNKDYKFDLKIVSVKE